MFTLRSVLSQRGYGYQTFLLIEQRISTLKQ